MIYPHTLELWLYLFIPPIKWIQLLYFFQTCRKTGYMENKRVDAIWGKGCPS